MPHSTLALLTLLSFGFAFGLFAGPMALLRIGIALTMLSGLGVLLATTSGHDRLAYWFSIGVGAVLVAFFIALLGALAGSAIRRLLRRRRPLAA
ncbi:hypothetical protein ACFPOE_18150 [Caenimonas terrae]|uniref:Major facilitator superfamily (MFS) profile domain-containing protein n=1 Tax=Caenimonas terrae TaxID=696074 RepID=A0ABW0NHL0_9BURK